MLKLSVSVHINHSKKLLFFLRSPRVILPGILIPISRLNSPFKWACVTGHGEQSSKKERRDFFSVSTRLVPSKCSVTIEFIFYFIFLYVYLIKERHWKCTVFCRSRGKTQSLSMVKVSVALWLISCCGELIALCRQLRSVMSRRKEREAGARQIWRLKQKMCLLMCRCVSISVCVWLTCVNIVIQSRFRNGKYFFPTFLPMTMYISF